MLVRSPRNNANLIQNKANNQNIHDNNDVNSYKDVHDNHYKIHGNPHLHKTSGCNNE